MPGRVAEHSQAQHLEDGDTQVAERDPDATRKCTPEETHDRPRTPATDGGEPIGAGAAVLVPQVKAGRGEGI